MLLNAGIGIFGVHEHISRKGCVNAVMWRDGDVFLKSAELTACVLHGTQS